MQISLYGAGQVNNQVATLLASRNDCEVRGPFGRGERQTALCSGADIVVIATTSFLFEVAPDIGAAVGSGSNVITTAEEAAFPWEYDEVLANDLDARARDSGVTIVGAGLNPGFLFDALVLTASGVTSGVSSIRVERVVDVSRFSATILRRLGIGFSAADFAVGVSTGTITGHIGFAQSMRIVAKRMGVDLERIDRHIEPVVAREPYEASGLRIAVGESAGFKQRYVGHVDGRPWFEALFFGHLDPEAVGQHARDEITILGDASPLHLAIVPGVNPQVGVARIIVNSFRRLLDAPAGWLTVGDLPPASPVGTLRDASRT